MAAQLFDDTLSHRKETMPRPHLAVVTALLVPVLACHSPVADLRAEMEAENAKWLAAWNAPNPSAYRTMYTKDALLLAAGSPPIVGPDSIARYWEDAINSGNKEHTFSVLAVFGDGRYAYQVAKWTSVFVAASGQRTPASGNTVRVFERQANRTWLTKVHIYNVHR